MKIKHLIVEVFTIEQFWDELPKAWAMADKRKDWRTVHFAVSLVRLASFHNEALFNELGFLLKIIKIRAAMELN